MCKKQKDLGKKHMVMGRNGWSGLGNQQGGGEEARIIMKTLKGVRCELDLQSKSRVEKAFQLGESAETWRGTKPVVVI